VKFSDALGRRSTIELMVLLFTVTVCLTLVLIAVSIAVVEIVNPDADLSGVTSVLTNVLSVILGALLGLLAGKSDTVALMLRPESKDEP
jgi:hypothetical protein